jgi:hypothetical protein
MTRSDSELRPHSSPNLSSASLGRSPAGWSLLSSIDTLAPVLIAAGLVARLLPAWRFFLNPDEALHVFLASQTSLGMANKAALTAAHPPLFILVLYYWRWLGQSEIVLRLPSVLAGTASCWFLYRWLKLVTDRATAFVGLFLFSFAPTLIWLSAEIRQYALLLLFMTACFYLAESALFKNSPSRMILFTLSFYGALLTHYSSLIFALVMGIYMLGRLYPWARNLRLFGVWVAGQIGGAAIVGYYLLTHYTRLRSVGMVRGVSETYVRKSLFHPGENHLAGFIALQTLRFFTYLFSHGVVGSLALLAFLAGIALLLTRRVAWKNSAATPRQLALLLGLPFVVECSVALAGIYPYGGTRHCILLAPFAVAGTSIALTALSATRLWPKPLIVAALVICNVFPSPPPMIRPRNQSRALMLHAASALRQSAPPGSVILADYQSGLVLGYYLCGRGIVQEFPPYVTFAKADCGAYTVITSRPELWKFYASDFPGQFAEMAATYGFAPGMKIWLFDTGWITDSAPALEKAECSAPQNFGENIVLCQLTVGGRHDPQPDLR